MPIVKISKCINCSGDDSTVKHEWLFDGLTLKELRNIKKITGMSQAEFAKAGDDGDPEALAALLWILHSRDKIKIPFDDVDLDFKDFDMKLTESEQIEYDKAEAEAKLARNGPKETATSSGPTKRVASKRR